LSACWRSIPRSSKSKSSEKFKTFQNSDDIYEPGFGKSVSVASAIPDRSLACNSRVSAQEGAYPPSRLRAFALAIIN
jgi:hypothetical protein